MAFRSIAVNETPSTSLVVTKPAGVVSGDVLVAFAVNDNHLGSITWPSGFTGVTGSPIVTAGPDTQLFGAALKIAGGSEPASYTISGSSAIIGGIAAFSGAVATQPHRSSATDNESANASPWSITSAAFASNTTATCDMVIVAGSDVTSSGDVVHSGPTGYTVRADIDDASFLQAMLSTKDGVASGESGVNTATGTLGGSTSGWAVFAIALELSAGGGATWPGWVSSRGGWV